MARAESDKVLRDAMAGGVGFYSVTPAGAEHAPADEVRLTGAEIAAEQKVKVSSPEMATLAAKYVGMSDKAAYERLVFDGGFLSANALVSFMDDVRSLAASVLAQAAPK